MELVGVDHVGIGTDFTQDQPSSFWTYIGSQQGIKFPSTFVDRSVDYSKVELYPKGLETPDEMPNIAVVLTGQGYIEEEVVKVLGGNWLRLLGEVWQS